MKKIITTAILSLLLANNAMAFDVNLRLGARGEEVKKVQKFLGVEQSGYYGQMTKKAVAEFQKSKGLPASGHWLAMTRAEAKKGVATSTATSTPVKVEVAASSTVVAKPYVANWNFNIATSTKVFSDGSVSFVDSSKTVVKLSFLPVKQDGTLAKVTRCEYTFKYPNIMDRNYSVAYGGDGYVLFEALTSAARREYTQVQCVAFDFVDGKYTEYKSEVIEIK
jgi:hypothetical protein